jgi:hypothetical protein
MDYKSASSSNETVNLLKYYLPTGNKAGKITALSD